MPEEKVSRRKFLQTAAATGIVGFGIGAGVGYGASKLTMPPPGVAKTLTLTETVTAGKPAAGVPKEPLKVGVISWFTGPSTMVGEAVLGGAQFAADVINAGGGVLGRKIEVVKRDAGSTDVTVEAYRRFVMEDKVDLVVGRYRRFKCKCHNVARGAAEGPLVLAVLNNRGNG